MTHTQEAYRRTAHLRWIILFLALLVYLPPVQTLERGCTGDVSDP